ncbi:MAG: hypothetical protein K0R62_4107 [Nonomuraea muscovyensis]|nr:hypothetical protein [Nonomuraea muscovyensis]
MSAAVRPRRRLRLPNSRLFWPRVASGAFRESDAVRLKPGEDQLSELAFLRGRVVTPCAISGCGPAFEHVDRHRPLGDGEFGFYDLARGRPRTGAGNAGRPVGDLIPTGPADAARKADPPTIAIHHFGFDAGVIVHAGVDEPPLVERHRDNQADTHVGHGAEITKDGQGRSEGGAGYGCTQDGASPREPCGGRTAHARGRTGHLASDQQKGPAP